ncbi:MAG: molybdopterin dinucleotide binding domain-containing protein [Candidatus Bathyarchaeia archaeon]
MVLVTGRSRGQGQGKEVGKFSAAYKDSVAVCEFDSKDLDRLGTKAGRNVKVSTKHGSVVVKAVLTGQGPHPGIAFIPYGPWASMVTSPSTQGTGMPTTKGLKASIEPTDEPVLDLQSLLQKSLLGGR